jgi:predicted Zn-dependent peptidase
MVFDELWKLISAKEPVNEEELWKTKMHIRGQHLISGENTNIRMNRLAAQEFYFGRHIPDEEILTEIDAVRVQKLQSLADEILRDALSQATIAVVGPEAHNHYQISSIKRLLEGHP